MEKVKFENDRGLMLVGDYLEADSDAGIVMAHGFKGNRKQYGKFTQVAEAFNSACLNVLSFDFSGHGESSDDSITLEKQVEDLVSAVDFIRSKGVERLGLFGLSLGGCTVLMSLKEIDDISCAVLLNPLTDAIPGYWDEKLDEKDRERLEDQGFIEWKRGEGFREKYRVPKELIETKKNLDQDKLLEGINIPVKIIQGKEDQTISLKKSRKASEKLENGSLSVIDDDHYWNESIDEVSNIATKFFSKNLFS